MLFVSPTPCAEVGIPHPASGISRARGNDEEHVTAKANDKSGAACQGLHNALILAYGTVTNERLAPLAMVVNVPRLVFLELPPLPGG